MTTNMQQYGYNKHIASKYIFNMYLWNIIDSKTRKEKKRFTLLQDGLLVYIHKQYYNCNDYGKTTMLNKEIHPLKKWLGTYKDVCDWTAYFPLHCCTRYIWCCLAHYRNVQIHSLRRKKGKGRNTRNNRRK